MKNILLIAFALTPLLSFAQAETKISKEIASQFETFYNAGEYQKIFELYAPEMAAALPLDKTTDFLTTLNSQVGKITERTFMKYEGPHALYKTNFEKALLGLYISVNGNAKINGILIKPYVEETENAAINGLQDYPSDIAETIHSNVKDFPANTQLSIAIMKDGKTNYYGVVNDGGTLKAMKNQDKVFEVGSITKVFTSTVLASLVADEKVKLDDNVNTFFPFPFKGDVKITLKDLANHTSGLPRLPENLDLSNMANPYKSYDKELLEEYLKDILKLSSSPAETYAYSNLGAGLLGYTLGLSQKVSFQTLLQKRVFDKYNLSNSYMNSQNLDTKLIKGLNADGEIVPNWDFDALFSAGGILSTTEDLAKFAAAHFQMENKELMLTCQQSFDVNENMKIGLGWHLLKTQSGQDLVWHNGGTGGYSSSFAINKDHQTAVIILSNVSAFNPRMGNIDKLCFELMEQVSK
ncbi:MAG: serine hydrolase [Bacteroidota bacterium]